MNNNINVSEVKGIVEIPDKPQILYKYRKWDKFGKSIITDNKIWFSSPRGFEDGKDCNLPERYPSIKELPAFFMKLSQEKYNKEATRQVHRAWVRYMMKNSPLANYKERDKLVDEYREEFFDRFGVLSVTEENNLSEMWEKYSDKSTGICIGFDTDKLLDYRVTGGGGRVLYVDELPEISYEEDDNTTKFGKNIILKGKKWAFEKEYRLTKFWEKKVDNERNRKMLNNTIVEIILGKNMNEKDREEAKELIKKHQPQAKIIEQK